MIDHVITNRSIHPKQILDVRALTSTDVGSDHRLILCKYRSYNRLIIKKRKPEYITKYNTESFANDSTQDLYQRRLTDNINNNPIEEVNDVEQAWERIKSNILKSAGETIGTRRININGKRNPKPWFVEDVKILVEEKRKAYLRYRSNQTAAELEGYKTIRNRVNNRIKELKKQYWEGFTKSMESDLYGSQRKIWNMLRNRKKQVNELIQLPEITKDVWEKHFTQLFETQETEEVNEEEHSCSNEKDPEAEIALEDIIKAVQKLKTRKSPGPDQISNEMIKFGGSAAIKEIHKLFKKILMTSAIPDQWRTSITVPVFKKGDKQNPSNYRGISLLMEYPNYLPKLCQH